MPVFDLSLAAEIDEKAVRGLADREFGRVEAEGTVGERPLAVLQEDVGVGEFERALDLDDQRRDREDPAACAAGGKPCASAGVARRRAFGQAFRETGDVRRSGRWRG